MDGQKPPSLCVLVERRIRGHWAVGPGSDANLSDKRGHTPLHFAAQQGSLDAARLLLARGAEVDRKDAAGITPLGTAVFNSGGAGDLIQLLRANGADAWSTNNAGQSPGCVPGGGVVSRGFERRIVDVVSHRGMVSE
jgi:ankyrin repeat protein